MRLLRFIDRVMTLMVVGVIAIFAGNEQARRYAKRHGLLP